MAKKQTPKESFKDKMMDMKGMKDAKDTKKKGK